MQIADRMDEWMVLSGRITIKAFAGRASSSSSWPLQLVSVPGSAQWAMAHWIRSPQQHSSQSMADSVGNVGPYWRPINWGKWEWNYVWGPGSIRVEQRETWWWDQQSQAQPGPVLIESVKGRRGRKMYSRGRGIGVVCFGQSQGGAEAMTTTTGEVLVVRFFHGCVKWKR